MLPTELDVHYKEISSRWYEMDVYDKEEAISDFLSDKYGFCHYGFLYEEINTQIHITNIEWDEEE
jgi:hypothetical protein